MKLICIGNSIVNGFPFSRTDSFPAGIARQTGWEVLNRGINGQSTAEILARFDRDVLAEKPQRMLLLTGANDFMFEICGPEAAMENIRKMLERARAAGIIATAVTPLLTDPELAAERWMPELHIDYHGVNKQLRRLAELIRTYCRRSGCHCADAQQAYRDCAEYVDGVHPTAAGYRFLASFFSAQLLADAEKAAHRKAAPTGE
ncbi:MAG: GDSL-type esterase/lipase family protein [Anaerovoracaceae bacterium]|jgi:acyl-CoA thioesterase-1